MQAGREIKFRGKRTDNGEFVYGCYSYLKSPLSETPVHYIIEGGFTPVEVDPETVGQFTGLRDKNGKEIYEGDVIQNDSGKKYLVKWGINCDGFIARTNEPFGNVYSLYHLSPKTEIIGNIYENPELLQAI